MKRLATYIIMTIAAVTGCLAMDFGLRFQSHESPSGKRTSLDVGDTRFNFDKTFKVGFFFNFYSDTMFGDICTITTDDGNVFSVVASYMNDGTYRLGVTANDKLHLLKNVELKLQPGKEDHIDFQIDKKNNRVSLFFNEEDLNIPFDLSKANAASFIFGRNRKQGRGDVAPIDLRNIRVFIDGQNTNHWDLKYHDSPKSSIDRLNGLTANVENPHWLIDDHSDWRAVYTNEFKENVQTAFNPENDDIYIVSDDKVTIFSPLSGQTREVPVKGGRRIMAYSNHLMYDTVSNRLINYNLTQGKVAHFDFASGKWDTDVEGPDEESHHFNHAYTSDGRSLYTFGGYGFYRYNNDLYKIDLNSGSIDDFKPQPELMPLTSAAAAVVDGTLYIFGGKGNASGKQELPSHYTYTMYAYDLESHKGSAIWTLDSIPENFLPTQSMYYYKEEDSFYLGSTADGGELIRLSRTKPEWNVASTSMNEVFDVHDFVFDLFRSKDGKRLYLVSDKRIDANNHKYNIFTISSPFLNDEQIIKNKTLNVESETEDSNSGHVILYIIMAIVLIGVLASVWLIRKKRNAKRKESSMEIAEPKTVDNPISEPDATISEQEVTISEPGTTIYEPKVTLSESETAEDIADVEKGSFNPTELESISNTQVSHVHFDRSKASISLLGEFCIRDKEGNDITAKFTSRLKSLLIILLLSCQKNSSGIKYQTIDEEIWFDKDEKSAQNNRNVTMRKLRILLEEIGDIPIVYDRGFFKIDTSAIMFDYAEICARIKYINEGGSVSPELVDEVLELLLMGPLLPKTRYEWLDQFKADYSDSALNILNKLLKYELGKDDSKAYKIAETISLHDPLSEESMVAKCKILSRRKMYGSANNVYQKFCAEYERSLGETYNIAFSDVCKMDI